MNKKYIKFDLENSPCFWWLRSVFSNYYDFVGNINYYGGISGSYVISSISVIPTFLKSENE